MTDIAYYENEDNHGNYQYTSLKQIIDNLLMEATEEDSFIKNTKRFNLVKHAKEAIRNINATVGNEILAFEITVPLSCVVVLPPDFVNYVRVSKVLRDNDGNYHLEPLDINYNIQTAIGYLQDHEAELLFDSDGYILTADSKNAYAQPFKSYNIPSIHSSKTFLLNNLSKNGEFTIDKRRGTLLVNSDLADTEIVIEYLSDGLKSDEDEITVHKNLVETIENWIYYAAIERKRNVPMNEKQRSLSRYKATLHKAKIKLKDITPLRIERTII